MNADRSRPRLLVLELWGVGDVALALPFLRAATAHAEVVLLAKAHAAPLLHRFAPAVSLLPLQAPWTAFSGKYRLHQWPWRDLRHILAHVRRTRFDLAVSARPDPRDHLLLRLTGSPRRLGFPRAGSGPLLTDPRPRPASPHRAAHWAALADTLGWALPPPTVVATARPPRRVVLHTGSGHPVRQWPAARFAEIAARLHAAGCRVTVLDDGLQGLDTLMDQLAAADLFIGNDSGPGHLAAALGVPTFTIFGPQRPAAFHPVHPRAAWIEGAPCPHKPCFDACRFPRAHCLLDLDVDTVWAALQPALSPPASAPSGTV